MKYDDKIITFDILRGEVAVTLSESGLMVKNWAKLAEKMQKQLLVETANRDDGHTCSAELVDLLIERMLENNSKEECGIKEKPDSGPKECWPFEESWF